jgi:hypothetical protein
MHVYYIAYTSHIQSSTRLTSWKTITCCHVDVVDCLALMSRKGSDVSVTCRYRTNRDTFTKLRVEQVKALCRCCGQSARLSVCQACEKLF